MPANSAPPTNPAPPTTTIMKIGQAGDEVEVVGRDCADSCVA